MGEAHKSTVRLTFWRLQLAGWLVYVAAIATSNFPLRHERQLVAFRCGFMLSTFAASFFVYGVCRFMRLRHTSLRLVVLVCIAVSAVLGLFCSAIALWAEIHLGGGQFGFEWSNALSNMPACAFVLFTWSALYFGVKQYEALEQEKGRLLFAEASARDAQLLALRYQLQPHFLFNTLNAISSLVVSAKPQQATQMISRLGQLLRSTLDSPDTHFVSLAEELVVVREYLSIEEIRFGTRLNLDFQVSESALTCEVPRFILQPLVENAIRHGIAHLPDGGTLRLEAVQTDSRLTLYLENAVPAERDYESQHGLGLKNTRKRLSEIYGDLARFEADKGPAGVFFVELSIPEIQSTAVGRETL